MATTKKAKKKSGSASGTIQIKLTKAHQKAAQKCLDKTGKIRLSFKEIVIKKLPKNISSSSVIVD